MPSASQHTQPPTIDLKTDLFSPEAANNPYPIYAQLQDEAPVYWHEPMQAWIITRYNDVEAMLKNPAASSQLNHMATLAEMFPDHRDALLRLAMLENNLPGLQDPPKHTRIRRTMQPGYTAKAMTAWQPKVQIIADTLLDQLEPLGGMDLSKDFSQAFTGRVITELLGASKVSPKLAMEWANAFEAINPVALQKDADGILGTFAEVNAAATEYITPIIEARRKQPQDDLISFWLEGQDEKKRLSNDELLSAVLSQIVAGVISTAETITGAVLLLLTHLEQLARLYDNPDLMPGTIDECLRHISPSQMLMRRAIESINLHGQTIRSGDNMFLYLAAANRDPHYFPEPQVFDIQRDRNPHLAFGYGRHLCLGRPLSLMEIEIAINAIFKRLPGLRLAIPAEQLEWKTELITRTIQSLPVKWDN